MYVWPSCKLYLVTSKVSLLGFIESLAISLLMDMALCKVQNWYGVAIAVSIENAKARTTNTWKIMLYYA